MASDGAEHREARYCAPRDFGGWHITIDGETTLCGEHSVEGHHTSGTVSASDPDYDPKRDCPKCALAWEHVRPDVDDDADDEHDLLDERVIVRQRGPGGGNRTGTVTETHDDPGSVHTVFVVDLDGAGAAHVTADSLKPVDDVDVTGDAGKDV